MKLSERPAESFQAILSGLVGAAMILWGAFHNGFDFSKLSDPEVSGALAVLLGFAAAVRTWWVARHQREGKVASAPDGTVH
jgi:hypothetical protein